MALQALQSKLEKQIRLFEAKKDRLFDEAKRNIRLDDEVRFIRSWIEKPLSIGAVTPSSKQLARMMASYVDVSASGPVVELGPGTGPITEALVSHGVKPDRLVLVEFDPTFCRLLRNRYPEARVLQGDAYALRKLLAEELRQPASAMVSGLPLFTKPLKTRLKMLKEAFTLMAPGAPFIQFTYAGIPPIPKGFDGTTAEPSDRVWMNIPPARVWVYRKD